MSPPETEWWSLIDGMGPGDHVLFWRDRSPQSDRAIEAFLRSAIARRDLVAAILPGKEWARLRGRLEDARIPVDTLHSQGHLIHVPSTDVAGAGRGTKELALVLAELAEAARGRSYSGLSILGEVASLRFARGDREAAEALEGALAAARGSARVLCLFDARDLDPLRVPDAYALIRRHTHTLTAVGRGRLVAESVAAPAAVAPIRAPAGPIRIES